MEHQEWPDPIDNPLQPFADRIVLDAIGCPFAITSPRSTVSDFLYTNDADVQLDEDAAMATMLSRIRALGIDAYPEDTIWNLAERLRQRG